MIETKNFYDIIRYYSNEDVKLTKDIPKWNKLSEVNSFTHLERAIGNLINDDFEINRALATPSRFAIWSADIAWLIQSSIEEMNNGNIEQAEKYLNIAQRNMRAFIDCCRLMDTQEGYMQFENEKDTLFKFSENT